MDYYIATKHLHLVSIIMALFSITGSSSSSTKITGIAGSNVTLTFKFNRTDNTNEFNHFNVNNSTGKIDDCMQTKSSNKITIIEANSTILYHMTNVSLQDDQEYYAVWITKIDFPFKTSDKVRLVVIVENRTTTVTPDPTVSSEGEDRVVSQSLSSRALVLILMSPLLLMAIVMPCVAWCLLRKREPKHKTQDSFISTVQERVAAGQAQASASSLVYSVLDFPQRPPTVLDINSDTQYATISYTDHSLMS